MRYRPRVGHFDAPCPYDVEVDEPKDIVWNGRVVSTCMFQADAEHIRRSLSSKPCRTAEPEQAPQPSPRVVAVAKVLHSMEVMGDASWHRYQEAAKELIEALEVKL